MPGTNSRTTNSKYSCSRPGMISQLISSLTGARLPLTCRGARRPAPGGDEGDVHRTQILDLRLRRDVVEIAQVGHRKPLIVDDVERVLRSGSLLAYRTTHGDSGDEHTADLVL